MSQKYPEGAILLTKYGKVKVLGCASEARFLEIIEGPIDLQNSFFFRSVEWVEEQGWTVEETPWVPKEGDEVWALRDEDLKPLQSHYLAKNSHYISYMEQGRLYPTEELAQAASERVLKAYKGE